MISVTWMTDVDRNTEYLECRNETPGKETDDVVKVYFVSKFDVFVAKNTKLEMTIAKMIFSKRDFFGKEMLAYFEIRSHGIYFKTDVTTLLPKEIPQSTIYELLKIEELGIVEEK